MSDGNHMQRSAFSALAMALSLLVSGSALASGKESATAIGIATANIAWEKPQDVATTFGEIAEAGFGIVRIGLKNPVANTYAALATAKSAGLKILVTFPLIDGSVSTLDAAPRPKSKKFFAAYGLSQIDPVRFQARLDDLLDFVVAEDIPLIGLELGNELNWSGYNGDLPLKGTGEVITEAQTLAPDLAARFTRGMAQYRQVFELAKASLDARPALATVKLVSAGLADINADFIRRSGATYLAPELVYDAYREARIFALSDAVGIHLYEPLRVANKRADRASLIDAELDSCGEAAFAARPCWITEFGTALPQQSCAPDDSERIALVQPLLDHLARRDDAPRVPFAFYYDWNADKGFALKRCGQPTALVDTLSRANGRDATP